MKHISKYKAELNVKKAVAMLLAVFLCVNVVVLVAASPSVAQAAAKQKPSKEEQALEQAELGAEAFAAGDYKKAAAYWKKATSLAPKNAGYQVAYGDVLMAQGQYKKALDAYDKAVKLASDNAEAFRGRGDAQYALKKYDRALAAYDSALTLGPEDAAAAFGRAKTLGALKRPEEALDAYTLALMLDPDNDAALIERCVLLNGMMRHDEALVGFDRLIEREPDNPRYLQNRSVALRNLYLLEEALADIDRAVTLRPNDATYHRTRGHTLYAMRRDAEAVLAYRRGIALCGKSEKGSYEYALNTMLLEVGDGDGVPARLIAEADELAKHETPVNAPPVGAPGPRVDPETLDAVEQAALAKSLYEATPRDYQGALVAYTRAIAAGSTDWKCFDERPNVLRMLNRYDDSIKAEKDAIERISWLAPEKQAEAESGCQYGLAYSLYALGRYDAALKALNLGIKLDPDPNAYGYWVSFKNDILVALGRTNEIDRSGYDIAYIDVDRDDPHYDWDEE